MNTKKLFIFFLLILLVTFIYSDETEDLSILEKSKYFEFNFGGGYQHTFGFFWGSVSGKSSDSEEYRYMARPYVNNVHYAMLYFSSCPQVIIPISFNFYINNNFALGFTYDIGFGVMLEYGFQLALFGFQILNKLRISHKIGSIKTMRFFLLEYGMSLYSVFHFGVNSDTFMFFGPSIFAGYEKTTKNRFCFTTGFIFEAVHTSEQFNYDYPDNYVMMDSWFFHFGIIFRYRFSFYRKLD